MRRRRRRRRRMCIEGLIYEFYYLFFFFIFLLTIITKTELYPMLCSLTRISVGGGCSCFDLWFFNLSYLDIYCLSRVRVAMRAMPQYLNYSPPFPSWRKQSPVTINNEGRLEVNPDLLSLRQGKEDKNLFLDMSQVLVMVIVHFGLVLSPIIN